MKILTVAELKNMYRARHSRRGYHDFVKMSLGILVSAAVLILLYFKGLERFELAAFDYRMKLAAGQAMDDRIVLIDIAEDSIEKIGRWPWSRDWHATMIDVLSSLGAKAIVFDVLFSEPGAEKDDMVMEEAIRKSGRVYLPSALTPPAVHNDKELTAGESVIPLERFSGWARPGSHIAIIPDMDGAIRRVPLLIDYNGRTYPQLGIRVALDAMGIDASRYEARDSFLGRYIRIGADKKSSLSIPVDENNCMLVDWAGKWGQDFRHYSFIEVLASYQDMIDGKKAYIGPQQIKNKICVIGLSAIGLHDVRPNPLEAAYPAVGTNANVMANVLDRKFVRRAPRWVDALLVILLGLFLSKHVYRLRPKKGIATAVLLATAYFLFSIAVFGIFKIWLSIVYPFIGLMSVYLVITSYNQIVVSTERTRLFTLATKDGLTGLYVIRHFKLLLEAEIGIVLMSPNGRLSLLMLDLDHFKMINDEHGHQAGDLILKGMAEIVLASCRPLDICGRYGGEEFIIMLPGADANGAALVAERIRHKAEETSYKIGNKVLKVTVSVGASILRNGDTMDDLMRRADEALYQAKERGRNRVSLSVNEDQL